MKKSFTQRLAGLRNGLSYKAFSEKTGVDKSALERYEKGTSSISFEAIIKICGALDISSDWLLGLSDIRNPSHAPPRAVAESKPSGDIYAPTPSRTCPECAAKEARIIKLEDTLHNLSLGRSHAAPTSSSPAAKY